eukprot:3553139-Rhodomonas_salina.1
MVTVMTFDASVSGLLCCICVFKKLKDDSFKPKAAYWLNPAVNVLAYIPPLSTELPSFSNHDVDVSLNLYTIAPLGDSFWILSRKISSTGLKNTRPGGENEKSRTSDNRTKS